MEAIFVIGVIVVIFVLILKIVFLSDKLNDAFTEIEILKRSARALSDDRNDNFKRLWERDVELFNLITEYLDVEISSSPILIKKPTLVKKTKAKK